MVIKLKKMKQLIIILISIALCGQILAQSSGNIITGIVEDGNEPVIGATVSVKGSTTGTMTDLNGKFSLQIPAKGTLVISCIGYKTKEVPITEEKEYKIRIEEMSLELGAVIVTALGIKREEKALGYAAQRIGGDAATSVKGVDIGTSLTGKVAGMQIKNSPDFNSPPSITLRGGSPLVVIDGVPSKNVGLRELSPDDIETYDVLKGGAASALYGSDGRNGAIMITTKRGSKPGVNISVNSNTMFQAGFLKLPKNQKSYSSGLNSRYTDPEKNDLDYVWGDKLDIGRIGNQWNPFTYQYEMAPLTSKGKNNFKNFMENSLITNNNVNVEYKGDKGSFRTSLTHVYQKAPFPNNKMNKFTLSVAGNVKLAKNLTIDASMNYNKRYSPQVRGTGYGGLGYIYNLLVWTGPEYDVTEYKNYWIKGYENEKQNWFFKKWYNNPYFSAYEARNSIYHDRLNSQVNTTYDPTTWLKTIVRVGYDFYSGRAETINPLSYRGNTLGSFTVEDPRGYMVNGDAIALVDFSIKDFSINGLFGGSIKFSEDDSHTSSTRGGLSLPGYYSLKASVEYPSASSGVTKNQTNSLYGKIGADWRRTVFIEFTGRNDWSSRLDKDNCSYFYPSISGSIVPSEIIDLPSWFNFLKFRGGWTVSKQVPGFGEINTVYSIDTNKWNGMPGATYPDELRPSTIKPQKQTEWEVGTELNFFVDRLKIDLSYYEKLWTDRISKVSISDASGFGYLYMNRDEEIKRKGWELSISGIPVKLKDFTWTATFNYTREREIYSKLDERSSDNLWVQKGARTDALAIQKWDTDPNGNLIHGSNGLPIYKPKSELIGYESPDWLFGFTNEFKYKDFTLYVSMDGRIGGYLWDQTDQAMWHSGSHIDSDNQWRYDEVVNGNKSYIGEGVKIVSGTVQYDNYGRVIKDDRVFAPNDIKTSYEQYMRNYNPSTAGRTAEHQMKKATFFKIRELSLGYDLPKKYASTLRIHDAKLSFVAQNLLMWTKDFKYTDPDGGERGLITPAVRYLGFNVKFSF